VEYGLHSTIYNFEGVENCLLAQILDHECRVDHLLLHLVGGLAVKVAA
jgi:hypothetical protein